MSPARARVAARTALAGNPSDGYGGAVVTSVVPDLAATVSIEPHTRVVITGPSGSADFDSLSDARAADLTTLDGGTALVIAALRQLHHWATLSGASSGDEGIGLALDWTTDIPRSVGLGGSSAIVIAALRALATQWDLEPPPLVIAALALAAERDELGIAAGFQDRAVQAMGSTVLVDAARSHIVDRFRVPLTEPVRGPVPIDLFVAWTDAPVPSGEVHRDLRDRFERGDPAVRTAMEELARYGRRGAAAIRSADRAGLGQAMEHTLAIREAIVELHPRHAQLADDARRLGVRVNFTGSGGAIVALMPAEGAEALAAWIEQTGYAAVPISVGGPR